MHPSSTHRDLARRLQRLVTEQAPESSTSLWVVDVLRDLCGWRSAELKPQHRAPRGFIDFQAKVGRDALARIEVKRAGRSLDPDMILGYLREEGGQSRHVFGLLTNGSTWELWLGGRWFEQSSANPVLLDRRHALVDGESSSHHSQRVTERLASLQEWLARRGLVKRCLEFVTDNDDVLRAAAFSDRTKASWMKSYMNLFTGPLPDPRRALGLSNGNRVAPEAVAAILAMRRWPVAKVVLGELRRLTGDRRYVLTKRRMRAMQHRLAEEFPLPEGW